MKIQFNHNVTIQDSMVFENIFEPELKYDTPEEKEEEIGEFIRLYMFVDDKIVGEIYAADVEKLYEDEPDFADIDRYLGRKAVYLHSTAILPEYQDKGLGKILKAYFHGYLKGLGYEMVIGLSTSPQMNKVNDLFGVIWITEHENWYDTGRIAKFYEVKL